jgi:hypothetical protein
MLTPPTVQPVMAVDPAASVVNDPGSMLAVSKLPFVTKLAWAEETHTHKLTTATRT